MMLNQEAPREYLLASGETHTVKEFIEKSFEYAGIIGYWGFSSEDKSEINEQFYTKSGKILVKINPKFYRPAEVDLLLGDPTTSINELGWVPEISFFDLVKEMVENDINSL
jgi:GDPmannose 4,6-dehydratase